MSVEFKTVPSCPTNASSWLNNGIKLQCPNDTLGRNLYQCVPNYDRSSLVEFCLQGSIGRYESNKCPYAVSTGHLDALDCSSFLSGCPEESYLTNEVFKYSACLEINPEKKCYLASENCPNNSMYSNDSRTTINDGSVNVGVILGVVIPLLVLLGITAFVFWRRRKRQRQKLHKESKALRMKRQVSLPDNMESLHLLEGAFTTKFGSISNMKVLSFAILLLWMCWVKLEAKENSEVKINEICSAEIQTLRQEMSALREEVHLQKDEIKQLKNEEPRNPEQKENRQSAQGPLRTLHAASKQKRFLQENKFSSVQFSDQQYKYRGKRWLFGQEQNVSLSTEHQIAFHANSPTHFRNLAVRQTLVFGNVILNKGNYYRHVTGIFTPDVSGVYVFYVQILMCDRNRIVHTELLVEGVRKGAHLAGGLRHCSNGGGMTIVHVNAGDSVWVRISISDGVNHFGYESSFSGFLLYED